MGWFDNEEADNPKAVPSTPPARPPAKQPAGPSSGSGSTLGREIHIDGSIVCDEDLTILGRVDGTIRANGTLVIAKEADVRAKIDGERVIVHGKVDGNVHGSERVVVGQTGRLTGNIEAPTLEINEGAYFKGSVEMRSEKLAKPDAMKDAAKPEAKKDAAKPAISGKAPERSAAAASAPGAAGPEKPRDGKTAGVVS
jgi:cytoskeletal protein CcmA (bactofilin family)